MKVADLVLRLQQLPPNAEILAHDADTGQLEPVSGYTYEPGDVPTVELCTDDQNGDHQGPNAPIDGALWVSAVDTAGNKSQAVFAGRIGAACNYPHCHCPFDHPGTEGWCAKGLKS